MIAALRDWDFARGARVRAAYERMDDRALLAFLDAHLLADAGRAAEASREAGAAA